MESRYSRNPSVESAPMRGESVLFNPKNNKFCLLNSTAAHLWSQLESPQTVQELAASIEAHFADVDSKAVVQDVESAVSQLLEAECIVKA
jgi:hypothetical protein